MPRKKKEETLELQETIDAAPKPKENPYTCETCGEVFTTQYTLSRHINSQHSVLSKEELKIGDTLNIEEEQPANASEPESYHCLACGGKLEKNQTPCPGCGESLDWGQV